MASGASCQSGIGRWGAGCGQTEQGSQQRQEREEDGWMRVARERHQFLSSSVRPSGRSCSNLPFTGAHLQGPLLLPTEKLAHIPTGYGAPRADLHLIQLLSPEAYTTAACQRVKGRNQSHLPALETSMFAL